MHNKRFMKKVVGTLLTVAMVLGMSACGNNSKESSTPASEKQTDTVEKKEETAASSVEIQEEQKEDITYPLDTDIELSLWSANSLTVNDVYSSWEESPHHVAIAEKTGVKIEWLYPTKGADGNQIYNLMWMQDDLPSMVYRNMPVDEGAQLLSDGLIYDLTDYIPQYMPDFWAYMNKPENAMELKGMYTEDGKIYGIPNMREGDYNLTYMGPFVRQDWLDECGLDYPVTVEDWENMLLTFKEKYNAGLGFEMGAINNTGGMASGFGALGFISPVLRVKDGKVVIAQMEPEWKELIELMHKWWDMGLIDKDSLTMNNDGVRNKAVNGEIGVTFGPMSLCTNIRKDAAAENNGAQWVGMEYPRTAAGEPTAMVTSSPTKANAFVTVVTTGCDEEELITALKWMNYGYTEEGMLFWNFGEEGLSYTLDANGTPQWTDLLLDDPAGINTASQKYCFGGAGPTIQLSQLVKSKNDPVVAAAVDKWILNTEAPSHYMPNCPLTEEENEIYTERWNAISTYISEEATKFWTGDRDLAEYDAFIEQINKLGAQEVIDVWQSAYDRYMAR